MREEELIEDYIFSHADAEPEVLYRLDRETHLSTIQPRMLSGHVQGTLLRMIVRLMGAKQILEVGTFTGYSAICMAQGIEGSGKVHTFEVDDEKEGIIMRYVREAGVEDKVELHIGSVVEKIGEIEGDFDMMFVDGDKREYPKYYEVLLPRLRKGGLMIADNVLWDGHVVHEAKANDMHTRRLQEFNDLVARDERVEKVILPLRDGLMMIRKK